MNLYRVVVPEEGHPSVEWAKQQANPSVAYPAVMPHTSRPMSGENNMRIPQWAWDATREKNTPEAWKALRRNNAGWINWAANKNYGQGEILPDQPPVLPVVEAVVTVGNAVHVEELSRGRARIRTSTPHSIQWVKFNSINAKEEIGNAPDGIVSYIPILAKDEAWLRAKDLEKVLMNENYAHGIDISKWDGTYNALLKPQDFVIQRLGYGAKADERRDILRQDIASVPIRGSYWYYSSGVEWKIQADMYLDAADSFYHFLALDYEPLYNNLNGGTAEDLRRIYEYIVAKDNRPCLIYSSVNGFNTYLAPYGSWWRHADLWIAQWPYKAWPLKPAPKLPEGVGHWDIWQYGGDAFGTHGYKQGREYGVNKDSVDLNFYNGTVAEMRAWAGINVPQPPPPPDNGNDDRLDELSKMQAHIDARRAVLS